MGRAGLSPNLQMFSFSPPPCSASHPSLPHPSPSLQVMSRHRHGVPTTVLAVGANAAVLVSEHGRLLDTLWLPSPPVQVWG